MKNIIKTVVTSAFLLFTYSNLKAQDDQYEGIYVDGCKVTELSCYSFGVMHVVVPHNAVFETFERVTFLMKTSDARNTKVIPKNSISSFVKGGYLVYQIFLKGEQKASGNDGGSAEGSLTRGALANFWVVDDVGFTIELYGQNMTGSEEYYDQGCSCYKRNPIYSNEKLFTTKIELKERKKIRGLLAGLTNNPSLKEVDLSKPCSIPGTKVDFNNFGKSGGTSISNSTTSSNSTPAKTETPIKTSGATGKTIITTIAPTSATTVKPLDKTKPGYFEEKSEDKKFIYRNGYQKSEGVYHGEVREYESNQLEKIITYTNGVEDGLYIIFSDGKVDWSGNYKNGKKDGVWKHFKNGTLEETEKYVNGEKQN